jgi:hypothetical protein
MIQLQASKLSEMSCQIATNVNTIQMLYMAYFAPPRGM